MAFIRRILAALFAVAFAVSMSVSAVHATEMALRMAAASAVDKDQHNKCPDCDQKSGSMKAMTCGVALCSAAQTVASLPQTTSFDVPVAGIDVSFTLQPSLFGWAHAPDPYPPR